MTQDERLALLEAHSPGIHIENPIRVPFVFMGHDSGHCVIRNQCCHPRSTSFKLRSWTPVRSKLTWTASRRRTVFATGTPMNGRHPTYRAPSTRRPSTPDDPRPRTDRPHPQGKTPPEPARALRGSRSGPHNSTMKSSRDGRTPPGPDIAGLRAFALEDDRLPPPAFVGRQDIIADIEHAVALAAAGGDAVRGRTRLVFGAPGAGKTALLSELARRWRARAADGDTNAPVPIDCEPRELTSPVAFAEAILSALVPDAPYDVAKSTTTEGGGGVPGVAGLSVSRTTSVPSLVDSVQAGRTPWAAIREATQPERLARPVVLHRGRGAEHGGARRGPRCTAGAWPGGGAA